MTITPELRQAVERAGDEPVRLDDPATNRSFVLISTEQFERMKPFSAAIPSSK